MRTLLLLALPIAISMFCNSSQLIAQKSINFWKSADESALLDYQSERSIIPVDYFTAQLDETALKNYLKKAPEEFSAEVKTAPLLMDIPMPNGRLVSFSVYHSPVMMPGLAARYPQIKSYRGHSVNQKGMNIRFTETQYGFHAAINTLEGTVYIDPYADNQREFYISYFTRDDHSEIPDNIKTCGTVDPNNDNASPLAGITLPDDLPHTASTRGAGDLVDLHVYRLALACTGEWGQGLGSVDNALAKMVTGVNRINLIMERDITVRLILVDNNDQLIHLSPGSDPFNNSDVAGDLLFQNVNFINTIIGGLNFDIGHLFTGACVGAAGVSFGLGTLCNSNKAAAVSCSYPGTSYINYSIVRIAAHEMGHQFGAPHTFSNCPGGFGGGAYEPGSGTSIMSYANACGDQNVLGGPHDYYHVNSLENIYQFVNNGNGALCPVSIPSNNHIPDFIWNYEDGFYIPISTPFELLAIATDEENDSLTYTWEQYNSGLISNLGDPQGNAPSFRSYAPAPSPLRVFPKMETVVFNSSDITEVLPTYSRDLNFRCTVRDNNPEVGGVTWKEVAFEATESAGPFLVTHPNNFSVLWEVGDYVEVTWDVANTDNNLVNCHFINIKLSTDGGFTYPVTLAENAPNDGSQFIVVPNQVSTSVRIRVEATNNIFFDISNQNFEIIPASAPGYTFDATPYLQMICLPEPAVIELPSMSLLSYNESVTFSVSGMPTGALANFTNNPAQPAVGSQLTIDMTGVEPINASYEVIIEGIAPDADTQYRSVFLDLVNNDFSALALTGPTNGDQGMGEVPIFSWTPTPNAVSYELQIATSPSFSEERIIVEVGNLTDSEYTSSVLLEKSTPFFWRVRPVNALCGPGPYTDTHAFHTEVFSCTNYVSDNVPIGITGQGTPTIESFINILQGGGQIQDLNVTKIKGTHNLVKHLKASLVSPAGTVVELFSGACPGANTSPFDFGIDDQAPSFILCPPVGGIPFLPQTPDALATFNGEDSEGLWLLRVEVINNDGEGGSLQEWEMEICTNASAAPPVLVNNNILLVPPGAFNYIFTDELLSEDPDNGPNELDYTLVKNPENGTLFSNGSPLEVGAFFSQSTINAGNLTYEHNGGTALTDQFTFTVSDGNGGWIGPTIFQVEIDENATVGVVSPLSGNELLIYPNPTKDQFNIKLATPVNSLMKANLYNVRGQLVASQLAGNGMEVIRFATANLSAGLYFVQVELEGQVLTEKVVVY